MNYVKESILKQLRKEAQQTVQQDQAKYDRLAPKLITNLIGDIGVSDAVTSKSDVPQELFPRDLKNLGALLMYLSANQIEWNGQQIASSDLSKTPESQGMDLKFSDVTAGDRDSKTRQFSKGSFFASKAAIVGYLDYLKRKAVKDQNKVLEVMIGKLVDQANRFLDPVDRIKDEVQGPNGYLLDAFSVKYFDASDPLGKNGTNPASSVAKSYPVVPDGLFASKLYSRDLASVAAFNNWFYQNIGSVTNKEGDVLNTEEVGKDSACLFLGSMLDRARYYSGVSRSAQATEASKFYLNAINSLSSQLECKIGAGAGETVGPNDPIDAFSGAKVLSSSKPAQDQVMAKYPVLTGLEPILTLADLATPQSFDAWGKKNQIGGPDICDSVRSLYQRGLYYTGSKTSPKFEAASKAYLAAVEKLAGQVKTLDGKECSLGGAGSKTGPGSKDTGTGGGDGTLTAEQGAGLIKWARALLASMPLEESQIDYERIMDFYKKLDSFYEFFGNATGRTASSQSEMAVDQIIGRSIRYGDAQGWRARTYSLSNDPMSTIEMITSFQMPKTWTLPFLEFNRQLVKTVMSDLNSLRSNISGWADQPPIKPLIDAINNQIGGGKSTSGGVGQRNTYALDSVSQKARVMLGGTR